MEEISINDKKTLSEKIRGFGDTFFPRRLGYYPMSPSEAFREKLPQSERGAICCAPVDIRTKPCELDTGFIGSGYIETVKRTIPQFKGLIYISAGTVSGAKTAMQLYADEYKLPICGILWGRIYVTQPSRMEEESQKAENEPQIPSKGELKKYPSGSWAAQLANQGKQLFNRLLGRGGRK